MRMDDGWSAGDAYEAYMGVVAGADDLPRREHGFDAVVSGLVLNFLPHPERALAAMRERLRPGGFVAATVWDYAEGMEPLRLFWDEAVALDPGAATHDEGRRFPICRPDALERAFRRSGLTQVQTAPLTVAVELARFDDHWIPFLGRTGPAPSYLASLEPAHQEALRARLRRRLGDGPLRLQARAWAGRGA
jgi:SAM-dependent methyltransferase